MNTPELSESVTANLAFVFARNKKYKCKTCSFFLKKENEKEKGTCDLTKNGTFSFSACEKHSIRTDARKGYWIQTVVEECPVCGKTIKNIKHIKDRPKPKSVHERFMYEQKYDHCMED